MGAENQGNAKLKGASPLFALLLFQSASPREEIATVWYFVIVVELKWVKALLPLLLEHQGASSPPFDAGVVVIAE